MKKLLWIAVVISCLVASVAGQARADNWSWLHPRPTGDAMGKIEFLNTMDGWMALENGRLLKTIDGGVTWQSVNPDTTAVLP